METKPTIFVIDDDKDVIESLKWLLESVNYQVQTFNAADDFLQNFKHMHPSCLVTDIRMPEITGLELQETMLNRKVDVPIIFITAYADVPMAVRAMKLGAVDFLTKPVNNQTLLEAINKALKQDIADGEARDSRAQAKQLINKLTPREYEIMQLLADGYLNKNIASKLDISQKTVELHRANIMRKMGIRTLAELVRIVMSSKV
ncbi:MAG: response regulator transcription factor [Gammaproteobacteria bacterium]|nr:response regulator transcription factor [Gammaproteobacteria bacterium]